MDKNDNDYDDHQQQKGYFSLVFANMHFPKWDNGLRKGSCFSLIRENIVQLGVIFCKRTKYAGNDITQLAQSPQKWVFELCNYQRKIFGRINMSLDNIYFFCVEQPSKDGSDILLSLVHSSLGENIWKPNAGFFSKLLVVNQFSLQVSFSKTYVSPPNHECIVFYQQSFHRNIHNLCIYIYIYIYFFFFFFFFFFIWGS